MTRANGAGMVAAAITALMFSACTPVSTDYVREHEPATLEPISGSELHRVVLQAEAAKRLDIHTAMVHDVEFAREQRKIVPYAAVLYDAQGTPWAYTNPEPLTFVRTRIGVDYVDGDVAVLSAGPPSGARVVTVGVAELWGVETGVGH
jgi:hypothetical protein